MAALTYTTKPVIAKSGLVILSEVLVAGATIAEVASETESAEDRLTSSPPPRDHQAPVNGDTEVVEREAVIVVLAYRLAAETKITRVPDNDRSDRWATEAKATTQTSKFISYLLLIYCHARTRLAAS